MSILEFQMFTAEAEVFFISDNSQILFKNYLPASQPNKGIT